MNVIPGGSVLFYIVTKVAWFFLQPLTFGLLLLAIGLFLAHTRWYKAGQRLIGLILLLGVAICVLPVGNWLALPLEDRFPIPKTLPKHIDGILVLGGGEDRDASRTHGVASMHAGVLQLLTAAALLRTHPEAQLYFSGGGASLTVTHPTEAEIARVLLVEMNADMSRVHFEDKSRNTWENLVFTKQLADPRPGQNWLLVISALHMPRSIGIAREIGWPMIAYPTDYTTSRLGPVANMLMTVNTLAELDSAWREWVGLAGYYLTGKTNALFPGPEPELTPAPAQAR